jgi:hypothetical protein
MQDRNAAIIMSHRWDGAIDASLFLPLLLLQ